MQLRRVACLGLKIAVEMRRRLPPLIAAYLDVTTDEDLFPRYEDFLENHELEVDMHLVLSRSTKLAVAQEGAMKPHQIKTLASHSRASYGGPDIAARTCFTSVSPSIGSAPPQSSRATAARLLSGDHGQKSSTSMDKAVGSSCPSAHHPTSRGPKIRNASYSMGRGAMPTRRCYAPVGGHLRHLEFGDGKFAILRQLVEHVFDVGEILRSDPGKQYVVDRFTKRVAERLRRPSVAARFSSNPSLISLLTSVVT